MWSKSYQDALRGGVLQHITRVTFTHPSLVGETALDFESGTYTLDETATAFATLHIAVQVPEDQAILDALDARTGARLRLYVGYRLPGAAEDVQHVADLALRESIVRRPQNLLELRAESDESLLAGTVLLSGSIPKTGVREALTGILNTLPGSQTVDTRLPSGYADNLLTDLEIVRGDNLWDAAVTIADSAELWFYADPLRVWHIKESPSVAGKSAWQLSTGPTGNITQSESVRSVELGFANAVLVRHTWKDSNDVEIVRIATAVSGAPYNPGIVGHFGLTVERETPASQAAIVSEAKAILRRLVTRGRQLNVDSPSAYWLEPGQTVTVQLPTGPQERHLVSKITFDLEAGNMTVLTRLPESVTITGE